MKANELSCNDLMIGDWVIFHDSGYASDGTAWKEDRVCQIDAIDVDVRVKWYDRDGYKKDWSHVSTFCLSPIPLTPEILEKNGFEVTRNMSSSGNKDVWSWRVSKNKVFHIIEHHNKKMFPYFWIEIGSNSDIKYVHQLQHALRLCEIEKEIKL